MATRGDFASDTSSHRLVGLAPKFTIVRVRTMAVHSAALVASEGLQPRYRAVEVPG